MHMERERESICTAFEVKGTSLAMCIGRCSSRCLSVYVVLYYMHDACIYTHRKDAPSVELEML